MRLGSVDSKVAGKRIVILGAGPAGYVGALRASDLGAEVTLVDRGGVGGACLHYGCIPTKALASACVLIERIRDSAKFGIIIQGEIVPRWDAMRARIGEVVRTVESGVSALLENRSVTVISGKARLTTGPTIIVEGKGPVVADAILICTGTHPVRPAGFPFDGQMVSTSDDLLSWTSIPESLVIVGEGAIACEFAFIFAALGVHVTMIGMMDRVLPGLDRDVSRIIAREMKKRRIKFISKSAIGRIRKTGGEVVAMQDGREVARAARAVVCVGRSPNTSGLGLEEAGISVGARGEVQVNAFMQTSIPGVYAAGDVTGRAPALAHVASAQASVAVDHILGRKARPIDPDTVPLAIFTNPEIGCVGLSEEAAEQRGKVVNCGTFDIRALGRAQAMGEIAGMAKVVADAETGRLLGVHIVGPHASDVIEGASILIARGGSAEELYSTIHAHPTISEAISEAAADVFGQAIHKLHCS